MGCSGGDIMTGQELLNLLVLTLIAVSTVIGLVLILRAGRRQAGQGSPVALGFGGGLLFGGALGTLVWLSTGDFVSWIIFVGGGMVLGIGVGSTRAAHLR
jgi:hypothetical protein